MIKTDHAALREKNRNDRVIGVILLIIAIPTTIPVISVYTIPVGLFCLFIMIGCFVSPKTDRTICGIVDSGEYSIFSIAAKSGRTEKSVVGNLKFLLRANIFPGVYLDEQAGMLVYGDVVKRKTEITVSCPHCGGNTIVPIGGHAPCMYCKMSVFAESTKP